MNQYNCTAFSIYKPKAKYGGLDVSEAKRHKGLEDQNAELKKLPVKVMLGNAMLNDIAAKNVTPAVKREAVCISSKPMRQPAAGVPGDRLLPNYDPLLV